MIQCREVGSRTLFYISVGMNTSVAFVTLVALLLQQRLSDLLFLVAFSGGHNPLSMEERVISPREVSL